MGSTLNGRFSRKEFSNILTGSHVTRIREYSRFYLPSHPGKHPGHPRLVEVHLTTRSLRLRPVGRVQHGHVILTRNRQRQILKRLLGGRYLRQIDSHFTFI